ncbi:olfactory receptor 6B1-like [Protopterus annectens]|uniref:olfactory receptor 6B1-like n=1 Tax=Protopterus annectens TaxID=7888 RepID=UPI001CF9A1A9|nr:olfactory receptor 6B1-like [Protopterus annectens]
MEFNETTSQVSYFIIVGFPGLQDWPSRTALFSVFFVIYVVVLFENIVLMVIIKWDEKLHSPMYIFIFNLTLLDLTIPSVTIPKMLCYLMSDDNSIGFRTCIAQMTLFLIFNGAEGLILAAMAYDRYQAICNPLNYHSVVTNNIAIRLSLCCWTAAIASVSPSVYFILIKQFCGQNIIFYFFCNSASIAALGCSTSKTFSTITLFLGLVPTLVILFSVVFSYTKILLAVLAFGNSENRWKAFSTCASHLIVLAIFFLILAFVSIFSRVPGISADAVILAGVIQNIFPPLVNPIIYCLKTKEIRISIVRLMKTNIIH